MRQTFRKTKIKSHNNFRMRQPAASAAGLSTSLHQARKSVAAGLAIAQSAS